MKNSIDGYRTVGTFESIPFESKFHDSCHYETVRSKNSHI